MLILLGLLVISLALAGLLCLVAIARRRLRGDGHHGTPGGAAASLALLVGIALFIGLTAVVSVVLRGGSNEKGRPATDPAAEQAAGPSTTRSAPTTPGTDSQQSGAPTVTALGPSVSMRAKEPDSVTFPRTYNAVGGLQARTVLPIQVEGFPPFALARALQCLVATSNCGNAIEVQFGASGRASFQYLVSDDFVGDVNRSRCRSQGDRCSIVVDMLDGKHRAEVQTVFLDPLPPPGRIHVTPASGLSEGQTVSVDVEAYPPGATVQAMLCVAPATTGTEQCGPPGTGAPLSIGSDGRASAKLTIHAGAVGTKHLTCRRGRTCGISVVSDAQLVPALVLPITFGSIPGADYTLGRLLGGLAAAVLLLAIVGWLLRRTDWSPTGEEASPEIDEADYADLDAILATFSPDEDPGTVSTARRRR